MSAPGARPKDRSGAGSASRASRPRRTRRGGAATAALLLFAVILYFQMNHTSVKLVIEDPSLKVQFAENSFTMDHSGKSIRVKPGEQTLTIIQDAPLGTTDGTLLAGGRVAIRKLGRGLEGLPRKIATSVQLPVLQRVAVARIPVFCCFIDGGHGDQLPMVAAPPVRSKGRPWRDPRVAMVHPAFSMRHLR